ncbi:OLC1v1013842C1 [Oldenlandia corymbosa var. corymbosa]|uniref:OLC1v1013842C1 n=1 Tax=Oldenlandia corymbosa var. corymbosa TaxID=529605 RepID=A0AAV1E053_OLDCO|nr:OLC1v1013842C1 [Oldenlandia corymbosa var. corymbosa]
MSAKQLWLHLAEQYGTSNSNKLYNMRKERIDVQQGDNSLVNNYNSLKRVWDEYDHYHLMPVCIPAVARILQTRDQEDKLIDFHMGMNKSYEAIKDQILLIDPPPTLHHAYAMVFRVEKQLKPSSGGMMNSENSAFAARSYMNTGVVNPGSNSLYWMGNNGTRAGTNVVDNQSHYTGGSSSNISGNSTSNVSYNTAGTGLLAKPQMQLDRRNISGSNASGLLNKKTKAEMFCAHYQRTGHIKEGCFLITGYPNWLKEFKQKMAVNSQKNYAHVADEETPLGMPDKGLDLNTMALQISQIQQSFNTLMKGKGVQNDQVNHQVNIAHLNEFADLMTDEVIGVGMVYKGLYALTKDSFDPIHIKFSIQE